MAIQLKDVEPQRVSPNGHHKPKAFCAIPQEILLALLGSGMSPAEQSVGLYVAYRSYQWADQTGPQEIGYDEFAHRLRLAKRNLIKAVHRLEAQNVITVERRRRTPRQNELNTYQLNPPAWWRVGGGDLRITGDAGITRGSDPGITPGSDLGITRVVTQGSPYVTTLTNEPKNQGDEPLCKWHGDEYVCDYCRESVAVKAGSGPVAG